MAEYNLNMSNILNIQKCLKIKGNDALSFVESLISNKLDNEKLKPSYLLRPDGKIKHWFFTHIKNKEISIYQENNELEKILDSLMQYAIRVESVSYTHLTLPTSDLV